VKKLKTASGRRQIINIKSDAAKFKTSMLEGVRRFGLPLKILKTLRFPNTAVDPKLQQSRQIKR